MLIKTGNVGRLVKYTHSHGTIATTLFKMLYRQSPRPVEGVDWQPFRF